MISGIVDVGIVVMFMLVLVVLFLVVVVFIFVVCSKERNLEVDGECVWYCELVL